MTSSVQHRHKTRSEHLKHKCHGFQEENTQIYGLQHVLRWIIGIGMYNEGNVWCMMVPTEWVMRQYGAWVISSYPRGFQTNYFQNA